MTQHTADRDEIAARRWAPQEGIIEHAGALARSYGLDPGFVEDLRDAYTRQDRAAWDDALARFLEALAEAKREEAAPVND